MSTALFAYPKQAAFNRVLPKTKIYEHAKPSAAVRELFVRQVEQIVWQYKLAPETINLPARPGVPEIQIFTIALKTAELNEDVLRCIDQTIPFPIIYQLTFDNRIKTAATYKRPSDADTSKWVVGMYFETAWQPLAAECAPLPVALDLGGLYEQILQRLIPLPARQQESLADLVARVEQVAAKQREVEKAASKLAKEKQFNRKVEINAELRKLKTELEELKQ
jgi:hypothetical protein